MRPVRGGVEMECREVVDGLGLSTQVPLLLPDLFSVVVGRLRLQCGYLPSQGVSGHSAISGFVSSLVEAAIKSTTSANSDIAHRCAASVLVVDGRVPTKNVAVRDAKDLGAGVAGFVAILVEPQCKRALGVHPLHVFGSK
jgi:hypothetical protein